MSYSLARPSSLVGSPVIPEMFRSPNPSGKQNEYGYDLDSGCGVVMLRDPVVGGAAIISGTVAVSYFRAPKNFTSTQARIGVATVAATATTTGRIGLYSADPTTGTLTELIASTANDTTLFNTINTVKTKAWSAPVNLVVDRWYAFAIVYVGTGTPIPGVVGGAPGLLSVQVMALALTPRLSGQLSGQTDLPVDGTLVPAGSANHIWGEVS